MSPFEQFSHLLVMAVADNRMNEAELGFLSERALQLGNSSGQFHDALQQAVSGTASLSIPKGTAERHALLKDLVMMMAADGELADREKQLFAHIASVMEFGNEELHRVIDATIADNS